MPGFGSLPPGDRVLSILAVSILVLFLLAIFLAFLTVVIRVRNSRGTRLGAFRKAKWDPVILEVLEGTKGPEELLDLVEPGEELAFLSFLLLYARRIRGGERGILQVLAGPHLHPLVERTRAGRTEQRAWAVQTLGLMGMPRYADTLLEALDDPSPLVSLIAAQSLAKRGSAESAQFVLERLHRYSEFHVAFLSGLLADAGPDAAPLFRSTLGDERRPDWVRVVVAQALYDLRDLPSADVAADILPRETNPDLLVGCLRLIAQAGAGGRHRESVIPFLESHHFAVRSYALKALRVLGSSSDIPLILQALQDESPWVALEAARGLRELGAVEPLRELARTEGPRSLVALEVISE